MIDVVQTGWAQIMSDKMFCIQTVRHSDGIYEGSICGETEKKNVLRKSTDDKKAYTTTKHANGE